MSTDAARTLTGCGMEHVVSCYNTRGLIGYVKRHYPELIVTIFDDLDPFFDDVDDVESFMMDEHNWISQHVCSELFRRLRVHSGDPEVAREVGRESIMNKRFGYLESIFIRTIGHPYLSIRRAAAINGKFNKTKKVEIVKADWSHAVVRLEWFPGLGSTRDICLFNLGIYESIPTLWDLPLGKITEHSCYFDGDEYCEFTLEWSKKMLLDFVFGFLSRRGSVLRESVAELEREKALTNRKYLEVERLNQELRQQVSRLTSLNACSRATSSILDTDRLLDTIMGLIRDVMKFERAIIMLENKDRTSLVTVKYAGVEEDMSDTVQRYSVPLDRTSNILVRVFKSGLAQKITDVENSPLRKGNAILTEYHPHSFIAIPLITRNRVIGVLAAERTQGLGDFTADDLEYVMNFCSQIAISLENARLIENMQLSFVSSILALASALEAKDPYTRGHSHRVATYASIIARCMGFDEEHVEDVRLMSLMHDIGKIGMPDYVLTKPGSLTDEEFDMLKKHPVVGEHIIQPLLPYNPVLGMVRHHHERFDGRGYPDGISGESIPIEARILSVADAYDAMTTSRSYRAALSRGESIRELEVNAGSQFCPETVAVFVERLQMMPEDLHRIILEGGASVYPVPSGKIQGAPAM